MPSSEKEPTVNREISWLAFNGRVLQEAMDVSVPLYERLAFLAIFSSNLDEFFRVRIASLRSLARLKKKTVAKLGFEPSALLAEIHRIVTRQQEQFGEIFRGQILPSLEAHGIQLIDEKGVDEAQGAFLRAFFEEKVRPHLEPVMLVQESEPPFLENRQVYLVVELWRPHERLSLTAEPAQYVLVEVPSPPLDRFVVLPGGGEKTRIMFLDDVIRFNLPDLFPQHEVGGAFAVKLSRDAELYLEDEYAGSLVEKIRKSLSKRETGMPCRFLYDLKGSYGMVAYLSQRFSLEVEDLVPGGRYHNLHDFFGFPRSDEEPLSFPPMPPLPHPDLEAAETMFAAVAERDHLLHLPYQRFGYVVRFLEEAASDPDVESIWITLYRVAEESAVVKALLRAAAAGKKVTAFVEVKARFDEATNLRWADAMEEAGVRTLYSMPGIKVHAKMALVERREEGELRRYVYLSTGNFNEKTARVYTDQGLFTADPRLTADVRSVFAYLADEVEAPQCAHLLVAPFDLRNGFYRLLDAEVARAQAGEKGWLLAKMNALEDEEMISRLYAAAREGVDLELIVRGICCLVPGLEGLGDRIRALSIVDRFLEHARVYIFHNAGEPTYYLSSADWMARNLERRVEIAFPLLDDRIKREVRAIMDLQRRDNVKARLHDAEGRNRYAARGSDESVRAQARTYQLLAEKCRHDHTSNL